MEFGSYALATSRKANVEMGSLFETPTFEWLDAHESKETKFYISLQKVPSIHSDADDDARSSYLVVMDGVVTSKDGVRIELF
jgi:hypothetical protein